MPTLKINGLSLCFVVRLDSKYLIFSFCKLENDGREEKIR